MLIEFRVANYRSIAEEQVLSLVANRRIKELEGNTLTAPGVNNLSLLESVAIYGANGAGKSNLILALGALRHIVLFSTRDRQLLVDPFALDNDLASAPSEFEISFMIGTTRYQYTVHVKQSEVVLERMVAYPEKRGQLWFERCAEHKDGWYFGPNLKGDKRSLAQATRKDALFLSVAASLNHEQLKAVYGWFDEKLVVLGISHSSVFQRENLRSTRTAALADPNFRKRVEAYLQDADLGITGFNVVVEKSEPVTQPLPDGQGTITFDMGTQLIVKTFHRSKDNEQKVFSLENESAGTQKLFQLIGPWIETLDKGLILVVDEAFSNIHPLLTRRLFEELHRQSHDGHPAQVVFTTHDTTILDRDLFRRDQIYFTEKGSDGATKLYSLQDFNPRKDEALGKNYLQGRYGAIPFLGKFNH